MHELKNDRFQMFIGPIEIAAKPGETAWLIVSDTNVGSITVELTRERIEALGKALGEAWDVATMYGNVRNLRTAAATAAAVQALREEEEKRRPVEWNRS